jgi:hypothetical protein
MFSFIYFKITSDFTHTNRTKKMSRVTRQSAPLIGSPEWFKYVNESIAPFKPNPQPHVECKEIHSILFTFDTVAMCLANNILNVSFGVKRVKYSIVAKSMVNNAAVKHLYLLSSTLTGGMIGCASNIVGDITETQTHEFIYQNLREFRNERLSMQLYNTANAAGSPLVPTDFTGVITLILELSNY